MRFVYFTLNKTEQKQKEMLGMISDEISPAGAFLRRILYVGRWGGEGEGEGQVNMKNCNLDAFFCQV